MRQLLLPLSNARDRPMPSLYRDARQIALPVDPAVVQRAAVPGAPEHWTAPELAELAGSDPVLACHPGAACCRCFAVG